MVITLVAIAIATAAPSATNADRRHATDPCSIDEGYEQSKAGGARAVTTRDLATLADIGRSDPYASPTPIGVSPDGLTAAFVVRRANPDTNSYCQRLVLVPTSGGPAREVDRGGEFMRASMSLWRLAALQAGFAAVVAPRWSPDGQAVAYLKRLEGSTQIWTVSIDGGDAVKATRSASDIEDFRWSPDGNAFIVARRPALLKARTDIEQEGQTGWLFDERFSPMQQHRPFPLEPIPVVYSRIDRKTGAEIAATNAETALIDPQGQVGRPKEAGLFAANEFGDRIWTRKTDPERPQPSGVLTMSDASGRKQLCDAAACARVQDIWWAPGRREAWFLSREGWANSQIALYRWRPGSSQPVLVLRSGDALVGCVPARTSLLCAHEAATSPRRIVSIDMRNGHQTTVLDPNPKFASIRLGSAQRFRFKNAYGVECYADLILPPDHVAGQKHPLVLVQYVSDGFLRGGTGDEVPIQALAAKGFAVLSFSRPMFVRSALDAKSAVEQRQLNRVGWVDRRSVQSAVEIAVKMAIDTGTVDSARMGISGLSDGASTTQWALLNSDLFSVAALGSCCEDRMALPLNGGPGYEQFLREMNYPAFDTEDRTFWAPLSLTQNTDRLKTPILIQTADTEYAMGLEVISALKARGKPLEVRVFPGEVHFKWQPAHRLAMYDRVVAWFRFWLMHELDCSPEHQADNDRWLAMMDPSVRKEVRCVVGDPHDLAHASVSAKSSSR